MRITEKIRNLKLKTKISTFALTSIIISILSIGYIAYNNTRETIETSIIENLDRISDLKLDKIEYLQKSLKRNLKLATEFDAVQTSLPVALVSYEDKTGLDFKNAKANLDATFNSYRETYQFKTIQLISTENRIVYKSSKRSSSKDIGNEFKGLGKSAISDVGQVKFSPIFSEGNEYYIYVAKNIQDSTNHIIGAIVCQYNISSISQIVSDYDGLGETGETILGEAKENKITFINSLRNSSEGAMSRTIDINGDTGIPMIEAVEGKNGNGIDIDYNGVEVIASWKHIPSLNWGLVSKINLEEAYKPIRNLKSKLLFVVILVTLVALLFIWIFAKSITDPIINLEKAVIQMGRGQLPEKIHISSKDEIGLMTSATNELSTALKETALFAGKIGQNEFDAQYKPLSEDDMLGLSLLKMRDNLKAARDREIERSVEDEKRNWAVAGFAEFGEILRNQSGESGELADTLMSTLINYLNANQGAIYEINRDNEKDPHLTLAGCYAWERKKYIDQKIKIGEGLAGQCWQENETIYITDVPDNYVRISSGLGEANPTSILIVPLKINEETHGIIEIASFKEFESHEIKFVEELGESIATSMANNKMNLQTSYLLEESKEMTEELRAQEEEMRQNMEEMQATQEEMSKVTDEKDRMILELQEKIKELEK